MFDVFFLSFIIIYIISYYFYKKYETNCYNVQNIYVHQNKIIGHINGLYPIKVEGEIYTKNSLGEEYIKRKKNMAKGDLCTRRR